MKTAKKIANILYQAIKGTDLDTAVAGKVFNGQMPAVKPGSAGSEAVVVNVITIDNSQFQRGTANVNIYVPDITINLEGSPQLMSNDERLDELSNLAIPILEYVVVDGYQFQTTNISGLIHEPEVKRHYVNFRIDFQFFPS